MDMRIRSTTASDWLGAREVHKDPLQECSRSNTRMRGTRRGAKSNANSPVNQSQEGYKEGRSTRMIYKNEGYRRGSHTPPGGTFYPSSSYLSSYFSLFASWLRAKNPLIFVPFLRLLERISYTSLYPSGLASLGRTWSYLPTQGCIRLLRSDNTLVAVAYNHTKYLKP